MVQGFTKVTKDHETIMKWVQDHEGKPAVINTTNFSDDGSGLLRVKFPGFTEEYLKDVSWDQFFQIFDNKNLTMVYKEGSSDGAPACFSRFMELE